MQFMGDKTTNTHQIYIPKYLYYTDIHGTEYRSEDRSLFWSTEQLNLIESVNRSLVTLPKKTIMMGGFIQSTGTKGMNVTAHLLCGAC